MRRSRRTSYRFVRLISGLILLLVALVMSGCRTSPNPFGPVDLSKPGWTQRQYQVVWQSEPSANELVCDVIEARNTTGQFFLQVSKTPIVMATVQGEGRQWWVKYGPRPRAARGDAPPDATHLWVLIALQQKEAAQLRVEQLPNQTMRWSNFQTGERIEGIPAS